MNKIYSKNIQKYEEQYSKQIFKSKLTAYARGFIFIVALMFLYLFWADFRILSGIIFILLILFLYLVKRSLKIKKQLNILKAYILINENENNAIKGDFSVFHAGKEFIDYNHKFSYDLDIFGEGSLFQYLNRSSTISGKVKLAEILNNIETEKTIILKRQEADKELSKEINWRQKFTAISLANDSDFHKKINQKEDNILIELTDWAKTPVNFIKKNIWKLLLYILPGILAVLLLLNILNIIPSAFIFLFGIINLSIVGFYLKIINKEHSQLENKNRSLLKLKELLLVVENKNFKSDYLNSLKEKIISNNINASCKINKLSKTLQAFDARLNIIVGVVLNFVFLWDLQILFRLEKQKEELKKEISVWFDVIAEFDAIISLANHSYNNSGFVYPKISDKEFCFNIKNGGHPLILKKDRVCNDFKISGLHKITIVTGANMAGKSTFLRTTGINIILGACGTTVCAESFSFSPIQIYTSVRTNDSLHKNESYFYAELMRLKKITDYLKSGKKLFIILDEMLKGTNSKDKHTGSKGLLEQLIKQKASGLVATHDIQLGKLSNKYPENISNKRFEVENINDKLVFDYKLKDGISKNLNASYLMKKYGIIQ